MIKADVDLLVLPYASIKGKSLLHILIKEFKSNSWTQFRAAIAFAKESANYQELINAMSAFLEKGHEIEMTFGADSFGSGTKGSDLESILTLLENLKEYEKFRLFLYHEEGRTFHPKMYLFSNEAKKKALIIVGSSNWSYSGLANNVEANTIIKLDMSEKKHKDFYENIIKTFSTYWQEPE